MRAVLIVNPNATSTTAAGRDLLAHALSSRVHLRVHHTTHRGHAGELARDAARDGAQVVIAHGGDGTVNEVVNGLLGDPAALHVGPIPALAVVPGGSANVFARSTGMDADPVVATNQLIELLSQRHRRRIGLAHADGRWFTFNAGLGIDAQVVEAMEISRGAGHRVTTGRYVRSAVRTVLRNVGNEPTLTVSYPGHEPVSGVHFTFVSNSSPWTFAGTRPVYTNPGTSFDTGLGVFAMTKVSVAACARIGRQMLTPGLPLKSKHLLREDNLPSVRVRSSEPIAMQMDGDFVGARSDVTFYSVPDALEIVAYPPHH